MFLNYKTLTVTTQLSQTAIFNDWGSSSRLININIIPVIGSVNYKIVETNKMNITITRHQRYRWNRLRWATRQSCDMTTRNNGDMLPLNWKLNTALVCCWNSRREGMSLKQKTSTTHSIKTYQQETTSIWFWDTTSKRKPECGIQNASTKTNTSNRNYD